MGCVTSPCNPTMKTIAKLLGGSHLYGLNTPESDIDERYIYAYDDVANIIGLDKNEHVDIREGGEDKLGYEVRRYLALLRKTNSQAVEFLYAPDSSFTILEPEFKLIRDNKHKLIDPHRFYSSLKGYIFSELRLATGERTGRLGGKRKEQLEKLGFSPKNFAHLLRLCFAGKTFFTHGEFPVCVKDHDSELHDELMRIKTKPEDFDKEYLVIEVAHAELNMDLAYGAALNTAMPTIYDHDFANNILFQLYYPILTKLKEK